MLRTQTCSVKKYCTILDELLTIVLKTTKLLNMGYILEISTISV